MGFLSLMLSSLFLLTPSAKAAFGNFNTMLTGEQASGMGGAYTAMSGDSSAAGFYNPASLVKINGTDVSASATVFNKYDTTYGEDANFKTAGERVNRGFFRTIPSAIGNVYRYRKWGLGFNIVVPDYDFFSGSIADTSNNQSFLSYTDESLWSGVVLSYRASPTETFGVSLYYTARSLIMSSQDRAIISSSHEVLTSEEKSIKHNGLVAVIGYQWDFSPGWTLGVSARPPAVTISGQGSYYQSVTDTANLPSSVIQHKNVRARTYIPPRYSLGVAWETSEKLTLSVDGSYYTGFGYRDMEQVDASDLIEHRDTWNVAIGAEYKMDWPKVNVRAGAFTNNSSVANPPSQPTERVAEHMNLVGFSGNINFWVTDQSSYTIGGFYTGGRGQSVQKTGNDFVTLNKNHHVFSLLISTSYKF